MVRSIYVRGERFFDSSTRCYIVKEVCLEPGMGTGTVEEAKLLATH